MVNLRQSTASQEVPLGRFVDPTDSSTAGQKTGLTIANTDIKLWKTGATTLASKNSGGATHISGGIYYATLDATDTDTVGPLKLFVHVSGAAPVELECCVMPQNVYDSFVVGTSQVTEASISAQVWSDDTDSGTLATILSTVSTMIADLGAEVIDGTVTRLQKEKYELAVLAGNATGLAGATPVFMDQNGDPLLTVTLTSNLNIRSVLLA